MDLRSLLRGCQDEWMRRKVLLATGCLVCAIVCWESVLAFAGTEFASGSLAGNQIASAFLFLLASIVTLKYTRSASMIALIACYFSLPLYFYLVFPRPFRQVWPGNWSVRELPRANFVWNEWWATGIFVTTLVAVLAVSELLRSFRRDTVSSKRPSQIP